MLGVSLAQTVTISPVGAVTVVEGRNLTITCTDGVTMGNRFALRENGVLFIGDDTPPNEVNGLVRTFELPVDRAKNGNTYRCEEVVDAMISADMLTLNITWPPVLSSEGMSISLREGENDTFNFTVDVGNPRSTMTITGPSQPGNPRVSISSEGEVRINGVSRGDAGTHIATWRNDAGNATYTLDLNVNAVCGIGCIIGIVVAIIAFIALVIVVAVVTPVCCICCECCICYTWCNKCRQKRSEDEEEDKGVSLT